MEVKTSGDKRESDLSAATVNHVLSLIVLGQFDQRLLVVLESSGMSGAIWRPPSPSIRPPGFNHGADARDVGMMLP